ncbi:hypothetical protein NDU88_000916 [Pleurodeles waltl]|uniref:Uncharacterized protein n=1 Tax=Pleurodeles waltl TaxID=8319 RepID=A0AAV7URB6_PLEWA|nr:hypothetical protein NDU88_000916 [Pleurodeles waltl]
MHRAAFCQNPCAREGGCELQACPIPHVKRGSRHDCHKCETQEGKCVCFICQDLRDGNGLKWAIATSLFTFLRLKEVTRSHKALPVAVAGSAGVKCVELRTDSARAVVPAAGLEPHATFTTVSKENPRC